MTDPIKVQIDPIGPGIYQHNLLCWLCEERPAVYQANPHWCFAPCWECQKDRAPYNAEAWWVEAEAVRERRKPWWRKLL